jgi:hypothetical protein
MEYTNEEFEAWWASLTDMQKKEHFHQAWKVAAWSIWGKAIGGTESKNCFSCESFFNWKPAE